ncbi:hypothetical protein TNCT_463941 [Trichonephila clavata]|uniref:Uncharacterized protein n=1 Tax=Trichonephila clavata TaxID=2740835 RepID=A0A8X6J8U4_TRICU|nr:hypothetical protein TNCT_463941 [Trichonephila clavata]
MSLKKKPSGALFRKRAAENQQKEEKEFKKVFKTTIFFVSNRESTETEPSDFQVCSSVGRENWNENNSHRLPSTSQTQSATDSDIAMHIHYTLLDSGFVLEDPGTWNIKDNVQTSKILNSRLRSRFF